jgi:hypothetical protein
MFLYVKAVLAKIMGKSINRREKGNGLRFSTEWAKRRTEWVKKRRDGMEEGARKGVRRKGYAPRP